MSKIVTWKCIAESDVSAISPYVYRGTLEQCIIHIELMQTVLEEISKDFPPDSKYKQMAVDVLGRLK